MKSETGALRCWAILTLIVGCLGAAAVFTPPAYAHDIIGWGFNVNSQVIPPPVGNDFVAIDAGGVFYAITPFAHSLALKSDGSIVGWGANDYGQATPPDGNNFVAIAAGGVHSLALKSDGSIVGWGHNYRGSYCGQATPPDGNDFVAIAAGGFHSLALKSDGSIVGWGNNYEGQATPPAGSDFVAIAAGWYHSLALKSNPSGAGGSIVGWGAGGPGQSGYPHYGQAMPPAGSDFVAIATGWKHSLALKSDGSIAGWGSNYDYSGDWAGQATPPDGSDFVAIAAGDEHSLALKSNGSIVGWGRDDCGQATPPAGSDFVAIAAGYYYSLALVAKPILSLTATNIWDGKTIVLSWTAGSGTVNIYRRKQTGPFEYVTTVSGSSYTDIVPDPGKNYTYVLRNTSGEQISNEQTVKAEVIVVLVRGYSPAGDGYDPDCWKSNPDEQNKGLVPNVSQWFQDRGLTCWDASSVLNGRKNIEWNSNTLKNFIANLRTGSYADAKVNLVAHSMGGLTSRRYANENEGIVSNIFCIQTPHTGSPLADLLGWFVGEARQNLQYDFLVGFNDNYPVKSSTNLYSFYSDNWTNVLDKTGYKITNGIINNDIRFSQNGEQSDGAVPYLSGQGQRYKKYTSGNPDYGTYYEYWLIKIDVWPMSGIMDIDFDHSTGHRHPSTLEKIMDWLGLPYTETCGQSMTMALAQAEGGEPTVVPQYYVAGFAGDFNSIADVNETVSIGDSNSAYFRAITSDANCSFWLIDPCGVTYDPCYAASEPNVTYETEDEIFMYEVNSPVSGEWTLNLSTTIAPPNSVDYGLTAFESENIALYTYSIPLWANIDANILIVAALTENDNPLTDANIVADIILPGVNSWPLTLYDDGLHSDANADDGIYANGFTSTANIGKYSGQITATGLSSLGTHFERNSSLSFTVSSPAIDFAGDINDVGLDLNGNGLYDILQFTVPVDVNEPNEFLLTANLSDNNDNIIKMLSTGDVNLPAGPNALTLEVMAEDIVKHDVNGPYVLSDIKVSDANAGLTIAEADDHNTAAYLINDFEQVDTDGDGLSDDFELSIGSDVNLTDSDYDGVTDYNEVGYDGDANSYNPSTDLNSVNPDTDSDGMGDGWEMYWSFDPANDDGAKDNDGDTDGLTNLQEYQNNTKPNNPDTDLDGMPDGWEVDWSLNPLMFDSNKDDDQDGLTNLQEYQYGTEPNNPDSDGDGLTDGNEVHLYGTDPNNSDSDSDTVPDGPDNCKTTHNPDQSDMDADGIGDECDLLPDISNDDIVDFKDLAMFGLRWSDAPCVGPDYCGACDFDRSGIVDCNDLADLAQHWLEGSAP